MRTFVSEQLCRLVEVLWDWWPMSPVHCSSMRGGEQGIESSHLLLGKGTQTWTLCPLLVPMQRSCSCFMFTELRQLIAPSLPWRTCLKFAYALLGFFCKELIHLSLKHLHYFTWKPLFLFMLTIALCFFIFLFFFLLLTGFLPHSRSRAPFFFWRTAALWFNLFARQLQGNVFADWEVQPFAHPITTSHL